MWLRKQQSARFYVQWHLLDGCNLRCTHCYQPEMPCRTLSFEDAEQVLVKLDTFFAGRQELPQINLTGGEPLLYPQLLPLIDRIRRRGWKWALLTNGTLLTQELVSALAQRQPVFVQVSLEGGAQKNDACRGKGTFRQICRGMDLLTKANIKTLVSFTVTANNWRDFPEAAAVCRAHRVHKLWCDRYVGTGDLALSTEDFTAFLQLLQVEREQRSGVTKIAAERSLQFLAGGSGYRCGVGRTLLVLLPDGTLLPCRRLPLELGNLLKGESVQAILDGSSVWQELQELGIPSGCIRCEHRRACGGGARCVTYAQTGSLYGRDVNCPITEKRACEAD